MTRILYFAWVRDAVGFGDEEVEIPENIATVGDLARYLCERSEGHRRAFADVGRLRAAVDLVVAGPDAAIADASEIAFFPPVTGG